MSSIGKAGTLVACINESLTRIERMIENEFLAKASEVIFAVDPLNAGLDIAAPAFADWAALSINACVDRAKEHIESVEVARLHSAATDLNSVKNFIGYLIANKMLVD